VVDSKVGETVGVSRGRVGCGEDAGAELIELVSPKGRVDCGEGTGTESEGLLGPK
jgi:hypothetical protein